MKKKKKKEGDSERASRRSVTFMKVESLGVVVSLQLQSFFFFFCFISFFLFIESDI